MIYYNWDCSLTQTPTKTATLVLKNYEYEINDASENVTIKHALVKLTFNKKINYRVSGDTFLRC